MRTPADPDPADQVGEKLPETPRDLPEWVPISGRPGWFVNTRKVNPDGSRPKMYVPATRPWVP